MTAEMTPAMERARHAMGITGFDQREAYLVLDAALDIEELARELFVADSWQDRDFVLGIWRMAPDDQAVKKHWRRIATALRTALLGADS